MNKKKKILIIVILVIIVLTIATLLLYRSSKKKVEILIEMSKNMYELNEGKDENVYMKSESSYGYTEVYRYLGTTKFIIYDKNTKMKNTSIYSDVEDINYLESDDGTTKIMCNRNVEKTDESVIENELFANEEVNIFETIFYGLNLRISNENISNKECYVLKFLDSSEIYYIDKENLLPIKMIGKTIDENGKEIIDTTYYDIQYNVVTENDVKELDETEFMLVNETEFDRYYE